MGSGRFSSTSPIPRPRGPPSLLRAQPTCPAPKAIRVGGQDAAAKSRGCLMGNGRFSSTFPIPRPRGPLPVHPPARLGLLLSAVRTAVCLATDELILPPRCHVGRPRRPFPPLPPSSAVASSRPEGAAKGVPKARSPSSGTLRRRRSLWTVDPWSLPSSTHSEARPWTGSRLLLGVTGDGHPPPGAGRPTAGVSLLSPRALGGPLLLGT